MRKSTFRYCSVIAFTIGILFGMTAPVFANLETDSVDQSVAKCHAIGTKCFSSEQLIVTPARPATARTNSNFGIRVIVDPATGRVVDFLVVIEPAAAPQYYSK